MPDNTPIGLIKACLSKEGHSVERLELGIEACIFWHGSQCVGIMHISSSYCKSQLIAIVLYESVSVRADTFSF